MAIVSHKEFKAFFESFFLPVYTLLRRYTGESELARDFAQEAFTYTVARNIYLDHCKHQRIRERYKAHLDEEDAEDGDFLKEVTRQETFRILYEAIDKLPAQSRSIILLNLKGNNNSEVAEALHISVNTVKSLKKSAYVALRKLLSKDILMILLVLMEK